MYAFIKHSLFKINTEHLKQPKNIYEWLNNPILSETRNKEIDKENFIGNLDYFRS